MPAETTHPHTECPPTADLDRLVRGRLAEARSAVLTDHVGNCRACQARLDALVDGGDLPVHLRDSQKDIPPRDSAYYKALAAAEEELRVTKPLLNGNPLQDENDPLADVRLEFLQPSDHPEHLGKLGQFRVLRVVGQGGMGIVLHAYDPQLQRDVAIKVIDPKLANNEVARQRFCREARAAASVTHDNLVAVHQVDEDEASGLPYLVMQLVNGESLEQRLRRVGKLSPLEVARIGMQAAAGLSAAHAGGLIHRDIKPGNILLESPVDRVKLTDFGLARAAEDVKLTRTGFVAGSPLYMSPEQARGDEVDHRADLFSLGSVLYEAASGSPAFDAKTPLAVLRRVADETPPLLHTIIPDIPEWLSDIVAKLLAKNPDDRFQNAAEVAELFATELARVHALSPLDVPAEVCPGSRSRSGTLRPRQHICWKKIALRALPWLGGAVLGSLGTWLIWTPTPITVEKLVEVPIAIPTATLEQGSPPRAILRGDSGAVWGLAFIPKTDLIVLGHEDGTIKIWDLKQQAPYRTLGRMGGSVWSADVSADGHYLVSPCDDSRVTVWNLDTFEVELSFPQPTSTKAAVFSPDGRSLATGDRNSTVRVWDIAAQIPVSLSGHRGTVHALAYSPDGTRLASAGSDGTAKVWNLTDTSAKPLNLDQHKGSVYGVAFSSDGTRIATAGWDGTARVWNANRGTQLQIFRAADRDAWSVSFGNGGKWLACAAQDAVRVWDLETGKEIFIYRGDGAFHTVRFANDGTTLAAGGRDGTVRVWDLR